MILNRREWLTKVPFLGALAGVAPVQAKPVDPLEAEARKLTRFLTSKPVEEAFTQITNYARPVPFATVPLNFYVCAPGDSALAVVGNRLDSMVEQLRTGDTTLFKAVLRRVWDHYRPTATGFEQVAKPPQLTTPSGVKVKAHRILSPRLTIDLDELSGARLARMLRAPVELAHELSTTVDHACKIYRTLRGSQGEGRMVTHYTPMEIYDSREHYIFDFFAGTIAAGYVDD